MNPGEGEELLAAWLHEAHRTLQPQQRDEVLTKFRGCPYPLYLKLAFEEARRWKSLPSLSPHILVILKDMFVRLTRRWRSIPSVAQGSLPETLSPDIPGIIKNMFARLEAERNHGRLLVSRALGYLAASRHGLIEDELLDVLSADKEVMADFRKRSPRSPTLERLPVVVWARLFADIEPYMTQRQADGTTVLTFYHRQVGEAASEIYLSGDNKLRSHRQLAEFFHYHAYFLESLQEQRARAKRFPPTPQPANFRKVSELPWQRLEAAKFSGEWDAMEQLFTDLFFLEAKAEAGLVFELAGDFTQAVRILSTQRPQCRILLLLEQALRRNIHFLSRHPTTLFQCMWNTCWWYDAPIVAGPDDVKIQHSNPINESWKSPLHLHKLVEYWRSLKEELQPSFRWLRSLVPPVLRLGGQHEVVFKGHTGGIVSVAFSEDGTRIATGSFDGTVRVWDLIQGKQLLVLTAEACDYVRYVHNVAFFKRSTLIVATYSDNTIRMWDGSTGQLLICNKTQDMSGGLACLHDGRHFVVGCMGGPAILDAQQWRCVAKLSAMDLGDCTGFIQCCIVG